MASSAKINDGNLKLAIIAYAKARPCIWDNSGHYNNNELDDAWRSFSEGFSLRVSELRERWEGLQQVYCQHLKESIETGADLRQVKWPYFIKLDEFLRTPTLRILRKEGAMPEGSTTYQSEDIEYIDLSSDSDSDCIKNEAAPVSVTRVGSSEKTAPENVVKLQTAEDVRNELRKIPPVAGSSVGVPKEQERRGSLGLPQQSKSNVAPYGPSLGPTKNRKSVPDIPDAKKRLIKNCGELIALKKVDPNEPRSLPHGSSRGVSSPPHKMFGSASSTVAPSHKMSTSTAQKGKSVLKKMKLRLEKSERKQFKRKSSALPTAHGSGTSGNGIPLVSSSDTRKLTEITKLTSGTAITMVPSGPDLPKVTVHLTPSSEGVTLHSVPANPKEMAHVSTKDLAREHSHSKKNNKLQKKEKLRQKLREFEKVTTDLIVLDSSDTEVTTTEPDPPKTSIVNPDVVCQQNDVDNVKPDNYTNGEDIWKKWEEEVKEIAKHKPEDESEVEEGDEDDPETTREVRKNFLLSFLPDMAEMTTEQRQFFKSKLMYLVCNIHEFQ